MLYVYSAGTSTAPELTSSMTSCGARPSIVQPTLCAVPRTSFTVPDNSRAIERFLMVRAMLRMSSNVILPLCLTKMNEKLISEDVVQSRILYTYYFSPSFCHVEVLSKL